MSNIGCFFFFFLHKKSIFTPAIYEEKNGNDGSGIGNKKKKIGFLTDYRYIDEFQFVLLFITENHHSLCFRYIFRHSDLETDYNPEWIFVFSLLLHRHNPIHGSDNSKLKLSFNIIVQCYLLKALSYGRKAFSRDIFGHLKPRSDDKIKMFARSVYGYCKRRYTLVARGRVSSCAVHPNVRVRGVRADLGVVLHPFIFI